MKTLSCLFVVLALAGFAVADDLSGKPPQDPDQPKVQKPLPDPGQPKVKKPLLDPDQPQVKKPLPDPDQPKVKKPLPDPDQPKVKKPEHPAWEDEFNQVCKQYDENKDGVVTLEEFQAHQPPGKDPAAVEKRFRVNDRDGDGALSKADFQPQPKVQKPLPDPDQPKVKKPLPDPDQPKVKKPLLDPDQPKVKKPLPDPDQPKVKKPDHPAWEDEFNQVCKQYDENKDGVVTLEEFQAHQPPGKDPAAAEKWFRVNDRNGDGALSKADFQPQPKVK